MKMPMWSQAWKGEGLVCNPDCLTFLFQFATVYKAKDTGNNDKIVAVKKVSGF